MVKYIKIYILRKGFHKKFIHIVKSSDFWLKIIFLRNDQKVGFLSQFYFNKGKNILR